MKKIVFLMVLLLPVVSTMSAVASNKARFEPYRFESSGGEVVEAELGVINVTENRSKEDSRSIELRFVRFKSTATKPGSPIVYLAGGPGGSGIDAARGTRFPLFMAMREFGDVIAFDQRGTGMSGGAALDCDEPYMLPFDKPLDRATGITTVKGAAKTCFDRLRAAGIDVSAYNTLESAADLNDLRKSLGAEKLTLWGISYGTHLALATMKYHPGAVDRVILAGLEPLHHSWKLPSDQQKLVETISGLAAEDPKVSEKVPDLLGLIQKVLAALAKEPQAVVLTHPMTGMSAKVVLGPLDLQFVLAGMLSGPSSFAGMPDFVHRLDQGDWTALALSAARFRIGEAPHAMSAAMDCSSGIGDEWKKRIATEAESTLLSDAINTTPPEACEGLGLNILGDDFREPFESDVPALLISGTLDGRTPVSNGEEVGRHLPNHQHLVIEGAGHSDPLFLSSPQILEAMQAFMRGKKLSATRIEIDPVGFIAPRTVIDLDEEALSKYVGTYRIRDNEMRRVFKAGNLLYTQRSGQPLPIRPTSATEFFYEGFEAQLEFEVNPEGNVVGMVVYQAGSEDGERAEKVK